jgi:hypothetical protein
MPVDRQGRSRFATLKVTQSKGTAQLLDFPGEVYHTSANVVSSLPQVDPDWIL